MKKIILSLLVFVSLIANAQFTSPNTGITYTPASLAAASGGAVVFSGGNYLVNADVTISANDKLNILTDEVFKFAPNTALNMFGTITVNPPTGVKFTAQNIFSSYNGVKLDGSLNSIINKLTFEYAVSFKVNNCKPSFDGCVFQYNNNNASTSFGNGAISLFNGNPTINNCLFQNNMRAAIQGGANIANAPVVTNCIFNGNNTTNQNVPQINLGASGTDTTKIIGCKFYAASVKSGAIGFLPIGNLNTLIKNNYLKSNRYGITISGGNNINAMISYNRIEDNNTDNNPATGGSGISVGGGSATSHQNTIITGNYIKGNLWGITILNFAKPNLGNLANADTSDNGKNVFINNVNVSEAQSDLYNNTPDDISAQGNYWNGYTNAIAETHIFHKPDNAALGTVDYGSLLIPYGAVTLTATALETDALLSWTTASEIYTGGFDIEKSTDGLAFSFLASTPSVGSAASATSYTYTDYHAGAPGTRVYYRLKLKDAFGNFSYSSIAYADLFKKDTFSVMNVYPSPVSSGENIYANIPANHAPEIAVQFFDAAGRLLSKRQIAAAAGSVKIILNNGMLLPNGVVFIKVDAGNGMVQTFRVLNK